jgi:hypothetical protein
MPHLGRIGRWDGAWKQPETRLNAREDENAKRENFLQRSTINSDQYKIARVNQKPRWSYIPAPSLHAEEALNARPSKPPSFQ